MNVKFRNLVAADFLTIRQFMAFAPSVGARGIVAYNSETAETLAIVVAQDWTQTSCQVHQVILNPFVLRHGWFEEVASYLFNTAGRKKLYGLVPSNNARALSVNEKCGFAEVALLEDAFADGVDYIVMELKPENCPYWSDELESEIAPRAMAGVVNG